MVSYLFPSIISWPNAANTFTVPPDTTIWAHIFKTFEDGYGYDCGLWRDAPLESVQWPPPAFLQLILPGSQCQIIHVGCSNTEYWLVVRLKRKCFREHEQDAWWGKQCQEEEKLKCQSWNNGNIWIRGLFSFPGQLQYQYNRACFKFVADEGFSSKYKD